MPKFELDPSVRPQDDFYSYVNGGWKKNTPIPNDRSDWGTFYELRERTLQQQIQLIHSILAKAKQSEAELSSLQQMIVDFHSSFGNIDLRNSLSLAPIDSYLTSLQTIKDYDELTNQFAQLIRLGITIPFALQVNVHPKNPERYVLFLTQSGLGLPDREYYLSDAKEEHRQRYQQYIADLFRLTGNENGAKKAEQIMALEKTLASLHWSTADKRDEDKTCNSINITEINTKLPGFNWILFLKALDVPVLELDATQNQGLFSHPNIGINALIAKEDSAIAGFADLFQRIPLETWIHYLTFHLLDDMAPFLTSELEHLHFQFHKTLNGVTDEPSLEKNR